MGHRGALYPWRTITGQEASAWYAAGTAQYHINADIAFAMHHYNRVTGDLAFMLEQGAEVLVETHGCGWGSGSSPSAAAGTSASTA